MTNQTNQTNQTKLHKLLSKQSFQLLKFILDSEHPNAVKLSETPYGHLGTDNMDLDQLILHHHTLTHHAKQL